MFRRLIATMTAAVVLVGAVAPRASRVGRVRAHRPSPPTRSFSGAWRHHSIYPSGGRALAVALATLLVSNLVGSVAAAGGKATVTVAPTVTGADVSVRVDVNRGTKQIAGCTFVLDANPAASCGAAASNGSKASIFLISLTDQAGGAHTISVSVRLSDGGSQAASASFTVAAQPPATYDTDNMQFLGFSERQSGGSLSNANTDLAFQGAHAYQGTFPGFRILDVSDPSQPAQLVDYTECSHPSGQGDVVVYGSVLTRSWDSASTSGMPAGGWPCGDTFVQAGQEGLHIFDISNPAQPSVAAFLDLPCGSHSATALPDPDNGRLIVYSSPANGNCDGIDVIVIPLAAPSSATYDHFDLSADLIPCTDTAVILGDVLRAACAGGQGFAVWSLDPAHGGSLLDPHLLYTRNIKLELGKNINTGKSVGFSNDGSTLIFGHEPDGGVQARCQATGTPLPSNSNPSIPNPVYPVQTDDMKSLFFFETETGALLGQWTLPRPQTRFENCALHKFNVVPSVEDRDILVLGGYQSGIGVVDFTDRTNATELAYADPAPLNPNALSVGGSWAAYYYNGAIWESDLTRGLVSWSPLGDVLGDTISLDRLNPQTQEFTTDQP